MAVYVGANNPVLRRVIGSLWDLSERYRRAYVQLPARANESTAEHRQLYKLLRARRAREAGRLVREHNDKTMRVLLEQFQENRLNAPGRQEGDTDAE